MTSRRLKAVVAALALGFVALAGLLAWQHFGADDRAVSAFAIGGPFVLADGDGKTVTDRDFRGRWMLLYFGYTHCPDACPTALQNIAVALAKLGPKAASVVPVFVTVDPERDTGPIVKDYAAAFGRSFVGLTGTEAQLKPIEHAFRVFVAKRPVAGGGYDVDHSSAIYVIDPGGRFVTNFTHETEPQEMADRLGGLIR